MKQQGEVIHYNHHDEVAHVSVGGIVSKIDTKLLYPISNLGASFDWITFSSEIFSAFQEILRNFFIYLFI